MLQEHISWVALGHIGKEMPCKKAAEIFLFLWHKNICTKNKWKKCESLCLFQLRTVDGYCIIPSYNLCGAFGSWLFDIGHLLSIPTIMRSCNGARLTAVKKVIPRFLL